MTDYTNNSYDDNVTALTNALRTQEGWGEGYDSSMGSQLIRLHADATANFDYMLFRRTLERYLTTAKLRTSVVAIASELGYLAKRATANNGIVRLTLTGLPPGEGVTEVITVPENTTFAIDGVNVISAGGNVQFNVGDTFVDVPVKAGTFKTLTIPLAQFATTGYIEIDSYENWDNDTLELSYSGKQIQFVRKDLQGRPAHRSLSFVGATEDFYDIRYVGTKMRIILGDNTFGKRPDADVIIRYLEVDNTANEVVSTAVPVTSTLVLTGQNTSNTYEWSGITSGRITNGKAAESIESIKKSAMSYTRSNGRAVTSDDTEFWVKQSNIGNIVDVGVMGEQDLKKFALTANTVYINYLTAAGTTLTQAEETALRSYMDAVLMTTVHPVIQPIPQVKVGCEIEVVKPANLTMANAEFYDRIKAIVEKKFALEEGAIGRIVEHSELVSEIQNFQFTRNAVTRNLVDFLKLTMKAYFPVAAIPRSTQHRLQLSELRNVNALGSIALDIEGTQFVQPYDPTETDSAIMTRVAAKIETESPYFTATFDSDNNWVLITSRSQISDFTVRIIGFDPINAFLTLSSVIKLPEYAVTINSTNTAGIYQAGGVEIVDATGTLLATHSDVTNTFVTPTGTVIGGSIDFTTGSFWKPASIANDAFLKYSHDLYGNMKTSKEAALVLQPFSTNHLSQNNFSKITIGA